MEYASDNEDSDKEETDTKNKQSKEKKQEEKKEDWNIDENDKKIFRNIIIEHSRKQDDDII